MHGYDKFPTMRILALAIAFTSVFSFSTEALAVERAKAITDREIIEGLANIRGDIKAVQQEVAGIHREIASVHREIAGMQREIVEVKEGQKRMEGRMDTLIFAVMGSLVALIGIVVWDRRTALSPVIIKNRELEEREARLEKALKDYAIKEPRLAEIFRDAGIL